MYKVSERNRRAHWAVGESDISRGSKASVTPWPLIKFAWKTRGHGTVKDMALSSRKSTEEKEMWMQN